MNKRQFLQLLPLAAVGVTTMRVDGVKAQVSELNPAKKYLLVIPDTIEYEKGKRLADSLRKQLGVNIAVVAGSALAEMTVYEMG